MGGRGWMHVAQDKIRLQDIMNTVILQNMGIFFLTS